MTTGGSGSSRSGYGLKIGCGSLPGLVALSEDVAGEGHQGYDRGAYEPLHLTQMPRLRNSALKCQRRASVHCPFTSAHPGLFKDHFSSLCLQASWACRFSWGRSPWSPQPALNLGSAQSTMVSCCTGGPGPTWLTAKRVPALEP